MAINFGLLQAPAGDSSHMQVVTPPNYAAQNMDAQTNQMKAFSDMATQAQQRNQSAALQPGLLQQQTLQNQGLTTKNASEAIDLQVKQQEKAFHDQDLAAYGAASKTGGEMAGMDAMNKSMMSHDPKGAIAMQQNMANLSDTVADKNYKQLGNVGNMSAAIMQQASQPGADGKPIDGLKVYKDQYPLLKKVYPDAPAPETFKSYEEVRNQFLVPTATVAWPYAKQQAVEAQLRLKNMTPTDLKKAQDLATTEQNNYADAVNKFGVNSSQAKQAKVAFDQAQSEANAIPYGHSPIAATEHAIGETVGNAVTNLVGGIGGLAGTSGQQPAPQAQQTGAQQQPAAPNAPQQQQPAAAQQAAAAKTINGVNYVQQNGKWYVQQ